MQSIKFELPLPPSTNRLWRSYGKRVVKSAEYNKYQSRAIPVIRKAISKRWVETDKPLAVTISFMKSDKRKFDIDNRFKALFDTLEKAKVFIDDNQIVELHATKSSGCKESLCVIEISEI